MNATCSEMQADIDNSGTIDYGEFIAATLHLNKIEREDHLFAAFSYFDKDGSGYITQDELQQACEEFGIVDIHLEELIREVDQDNVSTRRTQIIGLMLKTTWKLVHVLTVLVCFFQDGQIDFNEFVAMMKKGNADFDKKGVPHQCPQHWI